MPIYNMSRTFKKLTLQYAFLKIEKEEVKEICEEQETSLKEYMRKHYPDFFKEPDSPQEDHSKKPPEIKKNLEDTEPEDLESIEEKISQEPSTPKNKDLKNLYRKIVSKTHPDKIGDDKHTDIFNAAARAYESDDLAKLLEIAGSLNVEVSQLSPEAVALLKININSMTKEINTLKQSAAWAWASAKTEEEKKAIINFIINSRR
jgi:hypothetical protein